MQHLAQLQNETADLNKFLSVQCIVSLPLKGLVLEVVYFTIKKCRFVGAFSYFLHALVPLHQAPGSRLLATCMDVSFNMVVSKNESFAQAPKSETEARKHGDYLALFILIPA